ncbi:MAG: ABC transporter permease [Jatrophihabitans sp.]
MNATYVRMELIRLFRNRQNFIFSLIFPLIMFYAIASPNRSTIITGHVTVARFYLAGMIAFGTLAAVFAGGARIAFERQVGWNRQLRLTPLSPRAYIRTKILTSYLLAVVAIALMTIAALTLGLHLDPKLWAKTVGLVLVALIPFAAIGIMIGHLVKGDSMGPIIGGGISLFSILGGAYFPIGQNPGFMHGLVRLIPSFWLVQAGKTGIGGQAWTAESWIVIAAWTVAAGAGAAWAYRRDTQRT